MAKQREHRSMRSSWFWLVLGLCSCGIDSRSPEATAGNGLSGSELGDAEVTADRDPGEDVPGTPRGSALAGLDASITPGNEGVRCDDDGLCRCDGDAGACGSIALCAEGQADCAPACAGCIVDAECIGAGAANPNNPCEVCDPVRDAAGWSNADGLTCDDGAFCSVDDTCQAGACIGAARGCDDGVACNGTESCNEGTDACSPGESQCAGNSLCDLGTGTCVNTCAGCTISGTCVAGGVEQPGNPCFVCDPARSTAAYSAAAGKSCGSGPGLCSGQDTCDASGRCQPNHTAPGSGCGNSAASACDRPDTCDGQGACQQGLLPNASPCDDGLFCSTGDSCQGGVCTATGRNCASGLECNEAADACRCLGCTINGTCVEAGRVNQNNPCQVCDPSRSTASFSANVGANCGAAATECSAQDTCNGQGQCVVNDLPFPTPCTSIAGGQCQGNGQCAAPPVLVCGPCEIATNGACTPIGGNAACTIGDRAGRCAQLGTCQELCVVATSLVGQCLVQ